MSESLIDILLVDDEPRNLDALEAILAGQGYRLLRADGGDRALHLLLEHEVAAIVLDIKMPVVSGVELAKIIKGSKKFRQIPIVFLTAHLLQDDDVIAGYGAGAVDYLTKPVNSEILRHKIAVYAELFRKTRALASLNETLEQRVQERTAELERSEAALRAAAGQKDEFLAILAHELRNPLVPLRIGLDLLIDTQGSQPKPVTRAIVAMNRQLDHMVRLVDDLLNVTRISRGDFELKKEHVDLAALIHAAVEANQQHFAQRGHALAVETSGAVYASVDPTRVTQILGSLLHNAARYTPAGGNITIDLASTDTTAMIRIIDSGVGIPADKLDRIFDMFSRIERTLPGDGGLGLGLAFARRLSEMHGGTLTVTSSGDGAGSTFTLTLPASTNGEAVVQQSQAPLAEPVRSLRVLVIEDNEDVAETLVLWLEHHGHTVSLANTGSAGLELLGKIRPDVVLCDIGLPGGMSGIDVCKRVQTLPIETRPFMVALSGWAQAEDREKTKAAGFDHHFVKPVKLSQLFDVLQTVQSS
jgi:signal transduction histidine kinase